MKLDAERVLARCGEVRSTQIVALAHALVDEFNEQLDAALYSIDPTALERLGTLIAEHALGKRELPRPSELPVEQDDGQPLTRRELRLIRALMFGQRTFATDGTSTFRAMSGASQVVVTVDPAGRTTLTEEPVDPTPGVVNNVVDNGGSQ